MNTSGAFRERFCIPVVTLILPDVAKARERVRTRPRDTLSPMMD